GIRVKTQRGVYWLISLIETRRGVVMPSTIQSAMHSGKKAPGEQKLRVPGDSFIEQLRGFGQVLLGVEWIGDISPESFGTLVKVERRNISRRHLLNRRLFTRRDFGLELVGDRFGDLALNSEHVCEIAIVVLRPKMRVCPGVNQLCAHPHAVRRSLHTSFEDMGDAKLLGDLAKVASRCIPVLHNAGATDYFQVGDFGEIRKDFILHTVCEVSVRFLVA